MRDADLPNVYGFRSVLQRLGDLHILTGPLFHGAVLESRAFLNLLLKSFDTMSGG